MTLLGVWYLARHIHVRWEFGTNPDPANCLTSLDIDYNYLLLCTEMLTLISNLAPRYTRGAAGDSILRAVSDVEMLANATTAKLLSKADTVRIMAPSG